MWYVAPTALRYIQCELRIVRLADEREVILGFFCIVPNQFPVLSPNGKMIQFRLHYKPSMGDQPFEDIMIDTRYLNAIIDLIFGRNRSTHLCHRCHGYIHANVMLTWSDLYELSFLRLGKNIMTWLIQAWFRYLFVQNIKRQRYHRW